MMLSEVLSWYALIFCSALLTSGDSFLERLGLMPKDDASKTFCANREGQQVVAMRSSERSLVFNVMVRMFFNG